ELSVGEAAGTGAPEPAVEHVEVGGEVARAAVAEPVAARERAVEPSPDERQLAPVRLVPVQVADLARVRLELLLVAGERDAQFLVDGSEARGEREARRERAHVGAVAREHEGAAALE